MNTVITISRQYGSGGRFVGRLLADSLGIPFYDKEIIAMASENSGFAQDFIKEKRTENERTRFRVVHAVRVGRKPYQQF